MKTVFSPKSLIELKEAVKFYEKRKKGLGKRFSKAVKENLEFIQRNPIASELKYQNIRVSIIKKFPFNIHYYYEKESSIIFVAAIFHTSQNPDKFEN